ncbi:MAG: class I SAM-dependent methyltransferase [Flavobacteriales bacterium]|nr:class I SAM-dependent methyltransferase [Flavobacteriales bacterium]
MSKSKNNLNWFEDWFDSPYYHILYKNRDENEAEVFVKNLINFVSPTKDSKLLDIACGKGRHAITMSNLGFQVDAFDLSENSIRKAKEFETNNLSFYVNDIRTPLQINHYDLAFNLFTSFGYFENDEDDLCAIKAIRDSLKSNGILVMDFMNVNKVIKHIVEEEIKLIDGIKFHITKKIKDNFIIKNISFQHNKQSFNFQERVKVLSQADFIRYFDAANLKIETTFGNYNLDSFQKNDSERLILIARKQ